MNLMLEHKWTSLSGIDKKKYQNKIRILKQLYLNGPLSTNDIAKKTDLSLPTILGLINELIGEDLLNSHGQGESAGGRRPNLFGLRENSMYVVGIDVGRYNTRMAIFNNDNENITPLKQVPVKLTHSAEMIDEIHFHVQELIEKSGIDKNKIAGIGIDLPGLMNTEKGQNYTYLNTNEKPLQQVLKEKFGYPVYVENDAKARAYAEHRFGLAKGKQDVLVLYIGWGVGLGMILNGKIYRGKSGFSGEFSHIPMIENGALCHCGKRGCLETMVSATTLSNLVKQGIADGQESLLRNLVDLDIDKIETKVVVNAANMGDQFAIKILTQIGADLGKGIAILMQLFNPELIIVQGRLTEAKQYIMPSIQQAINNYCIPEIRDDNRIEMSELGSFASLLGVVSLLFENLFDEANLQ